MLTDMHAFIILAGVQSVLVLTPVPCHTSSFSSSGTYWRYFQTLLQGLVWQGTGWEASDRN